MSPALPRRRRRNDGEPESSPREQGAVKEGAKEQESAGKPSEQPRAEQPGAGAGAKAPARGDTGSGRQEQNAEQQPQAERAAGPTGGRREKEGERAGAAPAEGAAGAPAQGGAEEREPAPAPVFRAGPPPRVDGRVAVSARARYVRTSPRKARLVCEHIRGRSVAEARSLLAHTPRAVARDWAKLLESAVANAEHNHELAAEELVVRAAYADAGPTIKRFRPRAMGRATPIMKRTAHLTITLTTER
jgi:ribosomal protein L22